MRLPIPVTSSPRGHDRNDVQRLINCYIEQAAPNTEGTFPILGTPGAFVFSNTGLASIRGLRFWGGVLYAVGGGGLYSIAENGSASLLGPVPATGRVMMTECPAALIVLAGDQIVTYNDTVGFQTVTIPANGAFDTTPQAITVVGLSLVITFRDSDYYMWSEPNQPGTITATNFARAERNGDVTVTVVEDHNELLLIGARTIEVLYDTGAADGRFQSVGAGVIERGTAAADSVAQDDNSVMWLGDDRIVYRLNGRTPTRISSHAMEAKMQSYGVVSDAYGMAYTWNGHKFYVLTFPIARVTWEIDLNTGSVHERRTWGQDHWFPCCIDIGYGNTVIAGSAFEGSIYTFSDTYYNEGDRRIERMIVTPYVEADRRRFVTDRLEVDIDTGYAFVRGESSDPQLLMRFTENGKNWSAERRSSLGRAGEYKERVEFHRLGQARRRAYELRTTDAVPFRLHAIHAEVSVGDL